MGEKITSANCELYCRACLKEYRRFDQVPAVPSWYHLYEDSNLSKWINDVAELEFSLQMGTSKYPKYLCGKCYTQIKNFDEFMQMVEQATITLENVFATDIAVESSTCITTLNADLYCRTCISSFRAPGKKPTIGWYYIENLKKWTNDIFPIKLLMIIDKLSHSRYVCSKCYTKLVAFNEFLKMVNRSTEELSRIFALGDQSKKNANTDERLENILIDSNIETVNAEEFHSQVADTNKSNVGEDHGLFECTSLENYSEAADNSQLGSIDKNKEHCVRVNRRPRKTRKYSSDAFDDKEKEHCTTVKKRRANHVDENNEESQLFHCLKCGVNFSCRISFAAHEREHIELDGISVPIRLDQQPQNEIQSKFIKLEDKVNILTEQLEKLQKTLDNQKSILEKQAIHLDTMIETSFKRGTNFDIFPLKSKSDLTKVEEYIRTHDESNLIEYIKKIIQDANVSECMNIFFSVDFLSKVDWEASTGKIGLSTTKLFSKLIYEAVKNPNYGLLEYAQDIIAGLHKRK